jgi:hypothetical protein
MKSGILYSWLYNALKWLALLGLPTIGWLYYALSCIIWGDFYLPYGVQVMESCSIIGTAIGALIGVSQLNLNKLPARGFDTGAVDDTEV